MIYLDNAATTYPKPEEVYQKIDWANRNIAINAGRGSYKVAQEASRLIEDTRRRLIDLVHGTGHEHAVLLPSATIALPGFSSISIPELIITALYIVDSALVPDL